MVAILLLANLQVNCMATVGTRALKLYGIAILGSGVYGATQYASEEFSQLKFKYQSLGQSIYDKQNINEAIAEINTSATRGFYHGADYAMRFPIVAPVAISMYVAKLLDSQHRSTKIEPAEAVESKKE